MQNSLALGIERVELTSPHRPGQTGQDRQRQHHGQRNQEKEDVHDYNVRGMAARRAAFMTASSELVAMPRPASQGGIRPATANGTQAAL